MAELLALPYLLPLLTGAVSAAREGIRAYNNTSHATANPTTTQETLFDQDNWGRVLDSREIVYLVQPLIEKLYDPQISACVDTQTRSAFEEAQGEGSSSSDISSPQTTPKEMEDFLNEANTVARSATRLAEYLVICDGGPAGSTSTRWRLHVTAAIEAALETLDAYTNLSTQLRDAVSDTPMGNISAVLTLQDTEILPKAQIAFQPIFAGRKDFPYQLRLTSERQCLHIGELASSQRSGSSWSAWKVAGMVAGVAAAGAAGGLVLYGAKKIYEHRHPKSRSNQSLDRGMIGPMGGPNGKLAFVPTSNCPDAESLGKDLYQAAAGGHLTDVTSMLRKGADPSYCTEFRWTPLHWAASNGHVAIVRVLVHSGADLNALSDTKVTPLDMSMNEKHLVISEFLKSHRGLTSSQLSSEKIPIFQDDKSKNWETEICPIENEKGIKPDQSGPWLRYNMSICLLQTHSNKGLAADTGRSQTFKVVHPDERFQYSNRIVRVKDRVILKAEGTDQVLSREEAGKGTWKLDYGGENHCWTITKPL